MTFGPVRSTYELDEAKLAIYRAIACCTCSWCDCKKWKQVQLSADEVETGYYEGRRLFKVSNEALAREEKRFLGDQDCKGQRLFEIPRQ